MGTICNSKLLNILFYSIHIFKVLLQFISCWLLAAGCWLLAAGFWLLASV